MVIQKWYKGMKWYECYIKYVAQCCCLKKWVFSEADLLHEVLFLVTGYVQWAAHALDVAVEPPVESEAREQPSGMVTVDGKQAMVVVSAEKIEAAAVHEPGGVQRRQIGQRRVLAQFFRLLSRQSSALYLNLPYFIPCGKETPMSRWRYFMEWRASRARSTKRSYHLDDSHVLNGEQQL